MEPLPAFNSRTPGARPAVQFPGEGGASLKTAAEGGLAGCWPKPYSLQQRRSYSHGVGRTRYRNYIEAWGAAARRALAAGFKVIEIHAAHGYLLHEFLSPLSNRRTDQYGGNLENRMRFLLRVAEKLRPIVPEHLPLFVRISATDWVDGGWDIEQSVVLCQALRERGVDLIDVSSGGTVPDAKIPVARGYQVPFSQRIREEAGIRTGAVGMISDAQFADGIITSGQANMIFLARELLREPYWAIKAQHALEEEPVWPIQ